MGVHRCVRYGISERFHGACVCVCIMLSPADFGATEGVQIGKVPEHCFRQQGSLKPCHEKAFNRHLSSQGDHRPINPLPLSLFQNDTRKPQESNN